MAKRRRPDSARDTARRDDAAETRQLSLPLDPEPKPAVATVAPQPSKSTLAAARAQTVTRESRPTSGPHRGLGDLRAALEEGWEIVQPIFARPLWSVADDSATAFNFVLRREAATRLVIVPSGRGVQRFIRDRQLRVDYRQ